MLDDQMISLPQTERIPSFHAMLPEKTLYYCSNKKTWINTKKIPLIKLTGGMYIRHSLHGHSIGFHGLIANLKTESGSIDLISFGISSQILEGKYYNESKTTKSYPR